MHSPQNRRALIGIALAAACAGSSVLSGSPQGAPQGNPRDQSTPASSPSERINAIARGVEHILKIQEGDGNAEWPYEGVYRVKGEIPIGYRIGGTAINSMAILLAPEYANDPARHEAVERGVRFIVDAAQDPLMSPEYAGGYDVRGWGYTYGLTLLLKLKSQEAIPNGMNEDVEATIRFFIASIEQTEIPQVGGWNYSRGKGLDAVSPPSPFMTAPTLQALFEARKLGYQVDAGVVARGLSSLEKARTPTGSYRYSGLNGEKSSESVPGSVGRMLAAEATLMLAGKSDASRVRSAIDAFIVHWQWLEKRRCQQGTHVPPYGIAPYYFFYAHYYAAQAVELLPEHERPEYRRRIHELIYSVRSEDGTWNDRVFERSSNYGTSMAIMSLMMAEMPAAARWSEAAAAQ